MTKLLRLSDSSWPRSRDDLQATYPLTAFPADLATMAAADLAEFDHCIPIPTPAPIPGATEQAEEIAPVLTDGQWRQAWQLVAIPPLPSAPDWEQMRNALRSNSYSSAFNQVFSADSQAGIQLVAGLGLWEVTGKWGQFLQALLVSLRSIPTEKSAEIATNFLQLAHVCNMDQGFLDALETFLNGAGSWPEPLPQPNWSVFGQTLMTSPLIGALYQQAPPLLTHALTAGILRVRDGDSLVFASAWDGARQAGLLSPELVEMLENLALANNLPPEFIESIKPRRARNLDGTYRADDPNTPDVNEAWAP